MTPKQRKQLESIRDFATATAGTAGDFADELDPGRDGSKVPDGFLTVVVQLDQVMEAAGRMRSRCAVMLEAE